MDMPLLVQHAKNLQHLHIQRKLSYKSLTGKMSWERGGKFEELKARNAFNRLSQVVDPISGEIVSGTVSMTRLRTLVIKNYFNEEFIEDLISFNSNTLESITLRQDKINKEI